MDEPQRPDDVLAIIDGYVADVLAGRRVVGRLERLAVERHVRDAERSDGIRFNHERAIHVLEFAVTYIRHTKGEWGGKRFRFSERSAWMAFLLWQLFGWERKRDDGRWARRFTIAYISVARKNGKTMLAAIVALYMLAFDGEPGAEVYFSATKRDQAKIGWTQAAACVKKDPELRRIVSVIDSRSHMYVKDDECLCQALGRDQDSHDGLNPHLGVVDELHAHSDRGQWDVLWSAMGARREAMLFGITTAGGKREGLCWDLDSDAVRILESQIVDDGSFAFVARPDEGDRDDDPATWAKANPNLGESVSVEVLRSDLLKAQNNTRYLPEFRRKRLNTWTEESLSWLPTNLWDQCAGEIDPALLVNRPCVVAVDLSATTDYTAACVAWLLEDGRIATNSRLWIPRDRLQERERTDRVPVRLWAEQGHVVTMAGEVIDQDVVIDWLLNLRERNEIRTVGVDPYNAWKFTADIQKLGFNVESFRQGWATMSPAMKETEAVIRQRRVVHEGNPAMRWMFANVAIATDPAGNIKPNKQRSSDRIDGPVALIMAVGLAAKLEAAAEPPGIFVIGGVA